jgi:hypothetical protein
MSKLYHNRRSNLMKKHRFLTVLLSLFMVLSILAACAPEVEDETPPPPLPPAPAPAPAPTPAPTPSPESVDVTSQRYENLAKLGKVWGLVKYTHFSFISGQLDWDEELLNLITLVDNTEDINSVLYDWYVGLGDNTHDMRVALPETRRPMADLSWINYEYLGSLASHLLAIDGNTPFLRVRAPVFFNPIGVPNFSNQDIYAQMDYSDTGYRLLGLFRLWNAMNYYFPHLDVLDVEWNDLLLEFIPKMLEGTDRLSYELTIAAMSHHLHDAHVSLNGTTFFADKFGSYVVPVQLIAAEGQLVVYEASGFNNPLIRGDIILGINNRDIDEVIAEMRPFLSYPNEEKALAFLAGRWFFGIFPEGMPIPESAPLILRSHTRSIEIEVLRGGYEMTFNVNGTTTWPGFSPPATQSHVLMDNNIGLINPWVHGDVRSIMESFAATDGIIIDLRKHPSYDFFLEMRLYLMEDPLPFANISSPSRTHPGSRVDTSVNQHLHRSPYAFVYDRPVVLLMDEQTFSHPEWVIMSFRVAQSVTVIGPYSMGSNGNVASLPLPGGIIMAFTSLGVYTPEGGQTHRVGLAPDIRVDRTIQGIAEGRDELIEAAIEFILMERQ